MQNYFQKAQEQFALLRGSPKAVILAFESSCDETAAAVVRGGNEILSSIIFSQIPLHEKYGGVVPEIASRSHAEEIAEVGERALKESGLTKSDIGAIAVTCGAGLQGALLVGVSYAKALAFAWQKPLIKVNHLQAHISAGYLAHPDLKPPFIALAASGGHTSVAKVTDYTGFTIIAETADDAAGEAFDKVARVLGLGYPGGPAVERLAKEGSANFSFYKTPRSALKDISYSGLKTAVINYVNTLKQKNQPLPAADICAAFTRDAFHGLTEITVNAAVKSGYKKILICGGVAANSMLRETLTEKAAKKNITVLWPPPVLCTDNAAMVAAAAYNNLQAGKGLADLTLNVRPNLPLCE